MINAWSFFRSQLRRSDCIIASNQVLPKWNTGKCKWDAMVAIQKNDRFTANYHPRYFGMCICRFVYILYIVHFSHASLVQNFWTTNTCVIYRCAHPVSTCQNIFDIRAWFGQESATALREIHQSG